MEPEEYWRFCTILGRIDSAIQRAQAARVQLFHEYGLDPAVDHECNDVAMTITPKQPVADRG